MLGILLISNQFTDSFLEFFNFDEAYHTIFTEQEQRTDPLMIYVIHIIFLNDTVSFLRESNEFASTFEYSRQNKRQTIC